MRIEPVKLQHFVSFITGPHVIQDVPCFFTSLTSKVFWLSMDTSRGKILHGINEINVLII